MKILNSSTGSLKRGRQPQVFASTFDDFISQVSLLYKTLDNHSI
jgi:hypothetical protein